MPTTLRRCVQAKHLNACTTQRNKQKNKLFVKQRTLINNLKPCLVGAKCLIGVGRKHFVALKMLHPMIEIAFCTCESNIVNKLLNRYEKGKKRSVASKYFVILNFLHEISFGGRSKSKVNTL